MNTNKGFSLIELILYVAIVAIFITGVATFGWNVINTRVKNRVSQSVISNLRIAVQRIEFEIRNASSINSVGIGSLSLAYTDPARNPTIITLSSGRIMIGWGSSGSCPVSSPCPLTSNEVNFTKLIFTNMSSGSLSANVRYELGAAGAVSGSKEWSYASSATNSAEIRSY